MPRASRLSTADTLPSVPPDFPDAPLAAVEPEPATETPQRSPARQRLADAIEAVKALEAEVAAAGAAERDAEEARTAAYCKHEEAEETLHRARPRETGGYEPSPGLRSFWGSAAEDADAARRAREAAEAPPLSIADAKAALAVAQDEWDSARRLVQHHQDRGRQAAERLRWNQSSIGEAVRGVLRSDPALLALAVESRRLATRAEAARRAFSAATAGATIQPGSPYYGWDHVADARSSDEALADWSIFREWGAAIEALASDPDAPLPMPA